MILLKMVTRACFTNSIIITYRNDDKNLFWHNEYFLHPQETNDISNQASLYVQQIRHSLILNMIHTK